MSAARAREILSECKQKDIHFVCHKATIAEKDVCCRSFYDTQTSQMVRIAQRLGMVRFVSAGADSLAGAAKGGE